MVNTNYTYKTRFLTLAIVIHELIFWGLFTALTQAFGGWSQSQGERMEFLHPEFFWWFLLIPVLILVFYRKVNQRNKWVKRLKHEKVVASIIPPVRHRLYLLRFLLIRNTIAFIVIALMQPAFGSNTVNAKVMGTEIVFAVDLSNSMNVSDMTRKTTRLEAAKRAMNQFINTSSAAKVGLLVFAGSVYPQLPLTADKTAAKMYVENLSSDLISNQGTNISQALQRSADFFSKNEYKKYIVLITDGEHHEGGIEASINQLKEKDVELVILALGSDKGGLVPLDPQKPSAGYLKDDIGSSVVSKVNKEMVEEIASLSNAPYVVSDDAFPSISKLLTHVNNSKATKEVDLEFEVKANRYYVPLYLAIFCLFFLVAVEFVEQLKPAKLKR